jgi:hypothetical protein
MFSLLRKKKKKEANFQQKLNLILIHLHYVSGLLATHNHKNNNISKKKMKKNKSAEPILKRTNEP